MLTKSSSSGESATWYALSADTKPTSGVENGAVLIEMDTGAVYFFDAENGEWKAFGCSGGIGE